MNENNQMGGAPAADAASPGTPKITQKSGEWVDKAASKVNSVRQPVADKMHGAAGALRGKGESAADGIASAAHRTADTVDASATYLESHDVEAITGDVMSLVKRYPVQSLLIAGALGFVCGRALKSN